MLATLNDRLFLALNAPDHSAASMVAFAELAASWLVYAVAALVPALWVWGRTGARAALLACGFRRKPPTYSNLMPPTVPT